MRILAYAQLLQSYSSLTLDSLAHAFGVTVDFVDKYVNLPSHLARHCGDKSARTQECTDRDGDSQG